MVQIKIIPTNLTYPIRHEVLRKGKPLESCYFENDDLPTTHHFGIFFEEELIGVVSAFENKNETFQETTQLQIRGMAIMEQYRNNNFGALLINRVEEFAENHKMELLWFNAREKAVNFYKKNGYSVKGDPFEISNIGKHFLMFKKLV